MALNDKQIDKEWHEKNNFVVGETTFSSAKNQLGLTCFGKDSGNANNLADIILKGKQKNCQFLLNISTFSR